MRLKVKLIKVLPNNDKQTGLDIELNGRVFRVLIRHKERQEYLKEMIGRIIEVDFFSDGYITEPMDLGSEEKCLPDTTWPSGWIAGKIVTIQPGSEDEQIRAYEEAFDVKMRSKVVFLDTGEMLLEARLGSTETFTIGDSIKFYGTLYVKNITVPTDACLGFCKCRY